MCSTTFSSTDVNSSWIKCRWDDSSCPFPLILVTPLDLLAGDKVSEKVLNFQKKKISENSVLECAYYFFA